MTSESMLNESVEMEKARHDFPPRGEDGDYPTKASAAVALRLAGADFPTIAEELGYANSTMARKAYERVLAASGMDMNDIAHARTLTVQRLERLLLAVWDIATDPKNDNQMVAQTRALAIIDRIARLMGLDAPQQVVVHTPEMTQVERWVRAMAENVSTEDLAHEAEIIDAQVLGEDG